MIKEKCLDCPKYEKCGASCSWLCKYFSTCQEYRQVEEAEEPENVNHPDHYMFINGVEVADVINEILTCLDFTTIQGFYLGNVLKYILRAYQKNSKEDYEKAFVYLNGLIESM